MTKSIKISPVDYGGTNTADKSNLLDAPDGHWGIQCSVTPRASKPKLDDGREYPMLQFDFKLIQDLLGGNEQYIERKARVTDYIVLYPPGHKNFQMMFRKLHALCECAGVPCPAFTRIEGDDWFESVPEVKEFIDSVDKAQFNVWTEVTRDRQPPHEERTQIAYKAPRQGMPAARSYASDGE